MTDVSAEAEAHAADDGDAVSDVADAIVGDGALDALSRGEAEGRGLYDA